MVKQLPPIIQVGDVLLSSEILTEKFCCDLSVCKGECCVEGDAGAPVTMEEVAEIEDCLDTVWDDLSASAQAVIDKQGVAYVDSEADLVTSIVNGKDCVFTYYGDIEDWQTSCALYPIREKRLGEGLTGLNYNRWSVCKMAVAKGIQENLRLYQFLREPLIRRFGETWYQELLEMVEELKRQDYL